MYQSIYIFNLKEDKLSIIDEMIIIISMCPLFTGFIVTVYVHVCTRCTGYPGDIYICGSSSVREGNSDWY